MSKHYYTWLALGDSYTIGEGLPLHQSFAYQALQLLRANGQHWHVPEIVAQTGWTSFELANHLIHCHLSERYDAVSLLCGVNNQYRGLPVSDFAQDLDFLLKKAIHLAGGHAASVVVLSIPDWGVTPFAANRAPTQIAKEIDAFNSVVEATSAQYGSRFINIGPHYRQVGGLAASVAADGLHPSATVYAHWAVQVADALTKLASPGIG
jgi:lysophospholipase L1-like esterase